MREGDAMKQEEKNGPEMHDAAAGRTVPEPAVCSWNPVTAVPDCDFDSECDVHGKGVGA